VDCGVHLPGYAAVADFNGDGRMDLAMGNEGASIGVSLGLGGCAFTPVTFYEVPGRSLPNVMAADMDGDGRLDLVSLSNNYAIDQETGVVIVPDDFLIATLFGNGDGTFRLEDTGASLGDIWPLPQVLVGEITGDQRPDLLIPSANGQVTTMVNTCQ
jgi:FG-GAP-like repeat